MKISIITATCNSLQNLPAVLESISSQTYAQIEWIVIDGNSSDGSKEFFDFHSSRISKLTCEPDQGIYDALNKGLNQATGDIIGFLHSDDFFENEQVIEQIMSTFQALQCDGVFGDLRYVSKENTRKVIRYWKSRDFDPSLIKDGWMPAHPTLFLKKEVYQKHGQFDLDFKIASDYDFMLRILKDQNLAFAYLPQVITNMRVGGASNTLGNIAFKMKEDWKALRKNKIPLLLRALFLKNVSKIKQFAG